MIKALKNVSFLFSFLFFNTGVKTFSKVRNLSEEKTISNHQLLTVSL